MFFFVFFIIIILLEVYFKHTLCFAYIVIYG